VRAVMMNCSEFDELLHDLDRPRTGRRESELALAHAETCSRCARLLTETEALNYALRKIACRGRQAQAPARLESVLLREFQARAARRAGGASTRRQPARWYAAIGSIAAVALLALGLTHLHIGGVKDQPIQANTAGITNSTNLNASAMDIDANDAQNSGYPSSEEATAFVPLPDADESGSLEGGAVVRVAMPRATLASWGLPVSGMAGTDTIPAELLVSADGTPEAIRLLSRSSND
jgi:hypothetical protein